MGNESAADGAMLMRPKLRVLGRRNGSRASRDTSGGAELRDSDVGILRFGAEPGLLPVGLPGAGSRMVESLPLAELERFRREWLGRGSSGPSASPEASSASRMKLRLRANASARGEAAKSSGTLPRSTNGSISSKGLTSSLASSFSYAESLSRLATGGLMTSAPAASSQLAWRCSPSLPSLVLAPASPGPSACLPASATAASWSGDSASGAGCLGSSFI
mmetsp:Transcript_45459/g.114997  ORF Transcript_45459/g.114997 Transcript_45459/m.114997 type:complete len:219 (+) Transcript_45459:531-1187(+)